MAGSLSFHDRVLEIHGLVLGPKEERDPALSLTKALDDLCGASLPTTLVTEQQWIHMLVSGCNQHELGDDTLASFCRCIYHVLSRQIKSSSLRSSSFDTLMSFLLGHVESVDSAFLRVDALRAMSALLFESPSFISKHYDKLSQVLTNASNRANQSLEVCRMAVNCIGNACIGASPKLQPFANEYLRILLSNLCALTSGSLDYTETSVRKLISSTLRALHFLLVLDKNLVSHSTRDIIDVLHALIFMHVSIQFYDVEDSKHLPPPSQKSNTWRHYPTVTRSWFVKRQVLYKPMNMISSDSEFSDSDSTLLGSRRRRDDAKIRANALTCLVTIAKTNSRLFYANWQKFIPNTFNIFLSNHLDTDGSLAPTLRSDHQPYSLFTILLYDPTPSVRISVCNVLSAMFTGAKQYLSIASDKPSKSSFTSLSEKLASTLADTHSALVYAVGKETVPAVLVGILHVISVLAANSPYDRLAEGYLSKLYRAILSQWSLEDTTVRLAILQAISAVLAAKSDHELDPLLAESPCLLTILLDTIEETQTSDDNLEYKVEAWRTHATLARTQPNLISASWADVQRVFEKAIRSKHETERAAAFECMASYASAFSDTPLSNDKNNHVEWWEPMLEKYLQDAFSDESAAVCIKAYECLANMSQDVFEHLKTNYQRICIAHLLALPSHEDPGVRAVACRALGIFILFPSLRGDPFFVGDVASALSGQISDKMMSVRLRASWAQGNLCDALVLESKQAAYSHSEWIPINVWIDILTLTTTRSNDHDKIRSNAVRAMGSLLCITPKEYFFAHRKSLLLISDAMDALVKNISSGSLKTRWNACHAAHNALLNPDFPIGHRPEGGLYPWTRLLYDALLGALTSCNNFKVRINACLALATPKQRDRYGDQPTFDRLVVAIIQGWDASIAEQEIEFHEYKYKVLLQEQLLHVMRHLYPWTTSRDKDRIDSLLKSPEAQSIHPPTTVDTLQ